MTIEFNCPKCGALMAFDSKYVGKRAKCLTCGQKLLIPAKSFETPEKIEPEPEPREDPVPGFYRAACVNNWRQFVRRDNATTLVFVVAVVCFKFVLAETCCLQFVAPFIIWGWLFGFYLSIIEETAFDSELLPEIDVGTSITFLWNVIRPFLILFYTLFLVELPFFIALSLTQDHGVTLDTLWSGSTGAHMLVRALLFLGLFVFPSAILTTAVGKDLLLLRPDYLLAPILRAFFPYATCFAWLAVACYMAMRVPQYSGLGLTAVTIGHLALNLAVQVAAITGMRSIGLFYRHYSCYFKW
jgi:hypothetical protein